MSSWMNKIDTRLGPLAWQTSGHGPALVFFAGALANHDLWRGVIPLLDDRYRCIVFDLPLGFHPWPMSPGADLSPESLARLILDCVDLLALQDATLVVNDTAGSLVLLALASGHPALDRVGRVVLTNCATFEKFVPPEGFSYSVWQRAVPGPTRAWLRRRVRRQARCPSNLQAVAAAAGDLGDELIDSLYDPLRRDRRIADDYVTAVARFDPELFSNTAQAISRFDRPVLLIWGDSCDRYGTADACRLALTFPNATLVLVPGAKTWVPVDDPEAVAAAISEFAAVR